MPPSTRAHSSGSSAAWLGEATKGEAEDGSRDGKVGRFGCSRGFKRGGVGDGAEEGKAQRLGLVPCTYRRTTPPSWPRRQCRHPSPHPRPRAGAKIYGLEICRRLELTGVGRLERWSRSLICGGRELGGDSGRRGGPKRNPVSWWRRRTTTPRPKLVGWMWRQCRNGDHPLHAWILAAHAAAG
jgi:hypothetical protein